MMNNCTNNFIKRVIGVTRTFNWTITTNGAAVPLVAEDLTLQLVPPRGEAVSLPFDVDDNIVSFTWQGDDQHIIGCYSLILWANYGEDNQRRVDIHNFVELIPWSDRQSGEYSDLVEESIELETADFGENIMVVDNLNSTSATDALSANMGRQLNVTKQDVIQDLATIRSGAAAGAAVKEWAKNDPLITDDATQVSASKLAFNGNIFEQWVPGIASSIGLKGIAGFLKVADISQWDSAYNDRMLPTVAAVKAKLQAVLTALATIEAVIPSQASSTNKLTDKGYVDGAIATNTANFVGTFDSLAELQAVQNPTKNDYGFVIETDAQGNEYYDRYKYTGTQWLYEYKVESTPFTAEQWAAIQSGITAALVSKLSALPTNAELNTALASKQPVINDLDTIRAGAAAGATAYQKPSGGIPASDMASAVQTSLGKADSAYQKPSGGVPKTDLASAVQTSLDNVATNAANISALQAAYEGLTQSDIIVGALPASGVANTIYRVPGTSSYTDYMWNGSEFVSLASYNGNITAQIGYYECATPIGQTKVVDAPGYVLAKGSGLKILFTYPTNSPYININSTGRKNIYYNGKVAGAENTWGAGDVLYVYYDGTQYQSFNLGKPQTTDNHVMSNNGSTIDVVMSNKISGSSVNLYDKRVLGVVGYVNTSGGFVLSVGYEASYPIPIEVGKTYTFLSYPTYNANCFLRVVDSDGNALTIPKEDGTNWGKYITVQSTPRTFVAPADAKYAQFTTKWNNVDYRDYMMLLDGKFTSVTEYIPFNCTISKNALNEALQEEIDNKAEYVLELSKNLFDKSQVVEGKYVGYTNAGPSSIGNSAGAALSGLIEIEAGETYYLYRPTNKSSSVPAFVAEDGTTLLPCIDPSTNEAYNPYGSTSGKSLAVKAPSNAKYFIFTITLSNYSSSDCNGIQFEKGDHFTGYVDYYEKMVIPMEHLPEAVSNITKLEEDVEALSIQLNGDKGNYFHCSMAAGTHSYFSAPIIGNPTYSTFRQVFDIKRAGSLTQNPNFEIYGAGYAIDKDSPSIGLAVAVISDDICPVSYNGAGMYNGYLGGNHGLGINCVCTAANHGKTYADIGSVYNISGHNYAIAQVVDSDTLILLGESTSVYPLFNNVGAITGTYTHISGGTNTDNIIVTAVDSTQLRPIISEPDVTVLVDGKAISEDGNYQCNYVDIIESYKLINPASLYNRLVATAGIYTENPLLNTIVGLEYCARVTNKYRYQDKMCIISTSLQVLQDVYPAYFGFAQYGPVISDNSTRYVYIPNFLPYNGKDYRTIQNLDAESSQITAGTEYWENGKVPSRLLEYSERGGFHACFLPDYGFGNEIEDYTDQAFFIYTTKKYYPQPLRSKTKNTYSLVSARSYVEAGNINQGGVVQQSIFEYNGHLYLYLDFNAAGEYKFPIPDKFIGRNIETFEKTDNVVLFGDVATNEIVLNVSTASPMYGYFVGIIK